MMRKNIFAMALLLCMALPTSVSAQKKTLQKREKFEYTFDLPVDCRTADCSF